MSIDREAKRGRGEEKERQGKWMLSEEELLLRRVRLNGGGVVR